MFFSQFSNQEKFPDFCAIVWWIWKKGAYP